MSTVSSNTSSGNAGMSYLPKGLPVPAVENDGLDKPFREGLLDGVLRIQRCAKCNAFQWGPEWICHQCNSFDMKWVEVSGKAKIWSWTRCWHPVHAALQGFGPYIAVLVELDDAGGVRMLGNLLGDPKQEMMIGANVEAVIEQHADVQPPYALVQWRLAP